MMQKVYVLGETTYDIIFKDEKPINAKVGGSQLNTCVSLGRLGIPVSFVSQLGNDKVGDISDKFLQENGISLECISRSSGNSRVALAFLNEENNAEYTFFKSTETAKVKFPEVKQGDIVLFGSSYAIKEEGREELVKFLTYAKEKKAITLYDPNFRMSNINKLDKLKPLIEENIALSSIIKGSDEDFFNIFGTQNSAETFKILRQINDISLVYTANKNGVHIHAEEVSKSYPVPSINPVSTIGAGDNFNTGIIYTLVKNKIANTDQIKEENWDDLVRNSINFAQNVCMSYDNYISKGFAKQF